LPTNFFAGIGSVGFPELLVLLDELELLAELELADELELPLEADTGGERSPPQLVSRNAHNRQNGAEIDIESCIEPLHPDAKKSHHAYSLSTT
jgi:hypothetical protein